MRWLFDPEYYRRMLRKEKGILLANRTGEDLDRIFLLFREQGEALGINPSPFFDFACAREFRERFPRLFANKDLFDGWLSLPAEVADSGRISWHFDPEWYLGAYPAVVESIRSGQFKNALHHYLTNDSPRLFEGSDWFSEAWYLEHSPDIGPSLEAGQFRNGYDHFVHFGALEGRSPCEKLDLERYASLPCVQSEVDSGQYPTPFARFLAERAGAASESGFFAPEPAEEQTRALFIQEAEARLLTLIDGIRAGAPPPDFSCRSFPALSVIVPVHNHIALTIQTLVSLRKNYAQDMQLIVADNGSFDEMALLPRLVRGAEILRLPFNAGYGEAMERGMAAAAAPAILLLNNDIRLFPGAVPAALKALFQEERRAGVAARLVRTNMRIQEAGSILWRDGAAYGYRREDSPFISEVEFERETDYGSAAFLMLKKTWVQKVGGFDPGFRPAYFEDADLCLRMREAGGKIIYAPDCCVEHLEFGTSGSIGSHNLIQRHWKRFGARHAQNLAKAFPADIHNAPRARFPVPLAEQDMEGKKRRILFIEDRTPYPWLGSGYGRSCSIVNALAEMGHFVTVYPLQADARSDALARRKAFHATAEIVHAGQLADFPAFLQERENCYDCAWVARTHNWEKLSGQLKELRSRQPAGLKLILDTEVIAAPRRLQQRALQKESGDDVAEESRLSALLQEELGEVSGCDVLIAVNEADRALAEPFFPGRVEVLGHRLAGDPGAGGFEARRGIVFLGALHREDSPNYDSLRWFLKEIMPRIHAQGLNIPLTIAGYVSPETDLSLLGGDSSVRWLGEVADAAAVLEKHRVFVAPTRFAGGLPHKLHEAAARGIPAVATDILVRQLGWRSGREILGASIREPEEFARSIIALHETPALWHEVRSAALEAVRRDCDAGVFSASISRILARLEHGMQKGT